MTLTEARRYAVQKKTRIEFQTTGGTTCVVDEHGIARVPSLASAPEFVMTDEFDKAGEFTLIRGAQREVLSRDQLTKLAGPSKPIAHGHDEDE
jgi:hypothetical protein